MADPVPDLVTEPCPDCGGQYKCYPDCHAGCLEKADALSGEVVVMRASDLFELLGELVLPPYPCGCGGDENCAPLAETIIKRVREKQL